MFTMDILNIEQITSESVQESIANVEPWERDYAKQVVGTQYLFTDLIQAAPERLRWLVSVEKVGCARRASLAMSVTQI